MNGQMDTGRGKFNLSLHLFVSTQWCPVVAVAYLSCPTGPTSSEARDLTLHLPNKKGRAEVHFSGQFCLQLSVVGLPQEEVNLGALGSEQRQAEAGLAHEIIQKWSRLPHHSEHY